MAAYNSTKRGTLVIAGSGIASVAHITLETVSHIKEADKIFYVVCDPVTEAFIQDNAKGPCFDLTVFYSNAKNRYDSYVQMCEVILRGVREGHNVLGIFYGHPGVFVSPSHRAIATARQEGYKARMLPGVSAEDYMFADLEFDPAMYGCMSCEANELLLTDRRLNSSTHNIIWQVGGVGVTTLQFDNSRFHLLVDRLEKDFGPDHKVVHYIGVVLPQSDTIMDTFTIADLRKEDVVKQFNAISTLYIPPRDTNSTHSTMALESDASLQSIRPLMRWDGSKPTLAPANGPRERDIIAQIDNHVTPEGHRTLHISLAMKKFMTDLALKPKLLEEYKAKPLAVVESIEGLTELEKFGLKFGEEGPAYALMTATQSDIASGRELTKDEIVKITRPLGLGTLVLILVAIVLIS